MRYIKGQTNSGRFQKGFVPWNKGINLPEGLRTKLSLARVGRFQKDETGKTCGRWLVISRSRKNNSAQTVFWNCRCSCGKEKIVSGGSLRNGTSRSCGCLTIEASKQRTGDKNSKWISDPNRVKKQGRGNDNGLYRRWSAAVKRRDNHQCRMKNKDCRGWLEAHHILPWKDFPELWYNINNGISLCRFHHPRKRDDVIKLVQVFQNLLATAP